MNTKCLPKKIITPSKLKTNLKSIDEPYRAYKNSIFVLFYFHPYIFHVFLIYQFSKQYNLMDAIRISRRCYRLDLKVITASLFKLSVINLGLHLHVLYIIIGCFKNFVSMRFGKKSKALKI